MDQLARNDRPAVTAAPEAHLIAVHGNGGGSSRFARLGTRAGSDGPRPLVDGRVWLHAVDLPGFGIRAAETAALPETMHGFADALAELVDAVPRPRVVLGHGIGGSIALDLAARGGQPMDGLILHAPVGADLRSRRFPRLMKPLWVRHAVRRLLAARALRPLWVRKLFGGASIPREHVAAFFDGYARSGPAFARMFDVITADWFESLAEGCVEVPTVLLWGAKERILRAEQIGAFERLLQRSERVVVPEWDHFPMLETPDAYERVVAGLACGLVDDAAARARRGAEG